MTKSNRILLPIDLSVNSFAAIRLATTLAAESSSKLVFLFVAPLWLPDESMMGSDYIKSVEEDEKKELEKLRPTNSRVEYEHVLAYGNPGPEIVRASESCSTIVMGTHGRTGIMRMLMGSVAQYTMRNAKCPVILVKINDVTKGRGTSTAPAFHYVTEVMHQVSPIQAEDTMEKVLADLDKAHETAAPVVDDKGVCIGILTLTDISRHRALQDRYENKDDSVVEEIFETDKYGQVRKTNYNFDKVKRHMTAPVVTVANTRTTIDSAELLAANPGIHHLVVLDESGKPVGIVDSLDLADAKTKEKKAGSAIRTEQ